MPLLHHYLVHFILAFVIVPFVFVPLKVLLDRSKSMDMSTIHDLDVEYAHVPHARRTKSAKSGLRGDSKCLAAYSLELSAENIIIVNIRITSLVSSHELVLIRSFTRFYNAVWYLASLLRHM